MRLHNIKVSAEHVCTMIAESDDFSEAANYILQFDKTFALAVLARVMTGLGAGDRYRLFTEVNALGADKPLAGNVTMNSLDARNMLAQIRGDVPKDFHALDSRQVETVIHFADRHKYRQPRDANGSRARYFYAYLERVAARLKR